MKQTSIVARASWALRGRGIGLAGAALLALAGCNESDSVAGTPPSASAATPAEAASVQAPEPQGRVDVATLMQPQALPDIVIGDPKAPVTIVEYASLTCIHCADFHAESYPAIKANFIDKGKAKLIIREFPFDPRALAAFTLARCVPEGRRTAMVDVLFDQQQKWARAENAAAALLSVARLAGLSEDEFRACLQNKELQDKVVAVQQQGENAFGVSATPTFFVNGDRYPGALSADQMAAVIEGHL